jgi:hypothetical protein
VLIGAVLLVAAVLLAIGLLGDDDGSDGEPPNAAGGSKQRRQERPAAGPEGTVTLGLSIREPVQICLVGGGDQALIDGQVLNAGDEESYERKRFELRFPSGFAPDQFRLEIAGKERRLPRADGPVAYRIVAPQRVVVAADPPGEQCP